MIFTSHFILRSVSFVDFEFVKIVTTFCKPYKVLWIPVDKNTFIFKPDSGNRFICVLKETFVEIIDNDKNVLVFDKPENLQKFFECFKN